MVNRTENPGEEVGLALLRTKINSGSRIKHLHTHQRKYAATQCYMAYMGTSCFMQFERKSDRDILLKDSQNTE